MIRCILSWLWYTITGPRLPASGRYRPAPPPPKDPPKPEVTTVPLGRVGPQHGRALTPRAFYQVYLTCLKCHCASPFAFLPVQYISRQGELPGVSEAMAVVICSHCGVISLLQVSGDGVRALRKLGR